MADKAASFETSISIIPNIGRLKGPSSSPGKVLHPTNTLPQIQGNCKVKRDDLYKCLRPLLIFGRVIGLVSIEGVFSKDLGNLRFRREGGCSIVSLLIIVILSVNAGVAIVGFGKVGGHDATELARNAGGAVCYCMGLFVFIFIYLNSSKLIILFQRWREIETNGGEDKGLKKSVNLIAGLILTSAIAENVVSHLLLFPIKDYPKKSSNPLSYYYNTSHHQWSKLIPYHPTVALTVFLCNKWAVYAWNFGDILIAVVSRALYGKFKCFLASEEERLIKGSGTGTGWITSNSKSAWIRSVQQHQILAKLGEDIAEVLSPLVFTSFAVNIYFTCIQLHRFLTPNDFSDQDDLLIPSFYLTWSFLHLLLRTYVVALSGAKVHDYAYKYVRLILQECPRELYSLEIERAERRMAMNPVALHGFGTFRITRPFILSIISVIFTFEIVLLQNSHSTTDLANNVNNEGQGQGQQLIYDDN